jgi:hypothetical protein
MVTLRQLTQSGICRIGTSGGGIAKPSLFANVREQFGESGLGSSSECCQLVEIVGPVVGDAVTPAEVGFLCASTSARPRS